MPPRKQKEVAAAEEGCEGDVKTAAAGGKAKKGTKPRGRPATAGSAKGKPAKKASGDSDDEDDDAYGEESDFDAADLALALSVADESTKAASRAGKASTARKVVKTNDAGDVKEEALKAAALSSERPSVAGRS